MNDFHPQRAWQPEYTPNFSMPLATGETEGRVKNSSEVNFEFSLKKLLPNLKNIFWHAIKKEHTTFAKLEENISTLQDMFLEEMQRATQLHKYTLDEKITLRLDKAGQLGLHGEHINHELLQMMLENSPELSNIFRELAIQSELLRDTESIMKLISECEANRVYNAARRTGKAHYQISIKGDMSHFYFG